MSCRYPRFGLTLALGTTHTLAWTSGYYLPAILAVPMAADLGVSSVWVFGAFSLALAISAALGPFVRRFIDRRGGHGPVAHLGIDAGCLRGPDGNSAAGLIPRYCRRKALWRKI